MSANEFYGWIDILSPAFRIQQIIFKLNEVSPLPTFAIFNFLLKYVSRWKINGENLLREIIFYSKFKCACVKTLSKDV